MQVACGKPGPEPAFADGQYFHQRVYLNVLCAPSQAQRLINDFSSLVHHRVSTRIDYL
jgi:hypothetical protein